MPVEPHVALDAPAYAEGVSNAEKRDASLALLEQLSVRNTLIPAQCLGELFRVLRGKALRSAALARDAMLAWTDPFQAADSTSAAFIAAMDKCFDHGLQIWGALIQTLAADHRRHVLLSEDLQQGSTWRGVTVINPYAQAPHPLLA